MRRDFSYAILQPPQTGESGQRYRYSLLREYETQTEVTGHFATVPSCERSPLVGYNPERPWVTLFPNGVLHVRSGYLSDGPSGPTIDTPSFMRGAFVHDALYQLIREGDLPRRCRKKADAELRLVCIEDGMPGWRAWYVWLAVRLFGWLALRK